MAKDSERLRGGFDVGETGGAFSGLLAEEDEFDRPTLWRLGSWAAVSVSAVVVALVATQSSIGLRREQTASADLIKQAQQLQLAARESQSENRRLASAVDTLNSDRDRLYSRVAVLEQGLDSVTGAIARQPPTPSPQVNAAPTGPSQANANATPPASPSVSSASGLSPAAAPVATASAAPPASTPPASTPPSTPPTTTASVEPSTAVAKPAQSAPVVAPVIATAPTAPDKAALEKQDKQASLTAPSEPGPAAKPANPAPGEAAQTSGSLIASKSMMGPPDPAAGKLIEPLAPLRPATPPKTFTSAPIPDIVAVAPKAKVEEAEHEPETPVPVLMARHTEFGVDVGGANSVPGLRALWRGLLKSRSNVALTTLRPIIMIKENNNGLGMQLRLVAGPINDAAAAAKICASLTVSDRGCATTVFEGQRLSMGADEQPRLDARANSASEAKPVSEAKPDPDVKPASASRYSGHHRYVSRRAPKQEEPPKPEPSTLSRLFGNH